MVSVSDGTHKKLIERKRGMPALGSEQATTETREPLLNHSAKTVHYGSLAFLMSHRTTKYLHKPNSSPLVGFGNLRNNHLICLRIQSTLCLPETSNLFNMGSYVCVLTLHRPIASTRAYTFLYICLFLSLGSKFLHGAP